MLRRVGVAFDIDGVLQRGRYILPAGINAVKKVYDARIPFIFMTNGGGCTEAHKANQLAKRLQCPVLPEQVVLAHTPMKALVPKFRKSPVLVVGSDRVHQVARGYGFERALHIKQLALMHPDFVPLSHLLARSEFEAPLEPVTPEDIEAVFVFNDGQDWGSETQLICDVLCSGLEQRGEQTPLFFSNPDFLWAAECPRHRFGQGAMRICVQSVFEELAQRPLEFTQYGKPTTFMYAFAESVLHELAAANDSGPPTQIYGIGDNPLSDIRGANAHDGWTSVAVETGIFKRTTKNCNDVPDLVFEDVEQAVDFIVAQASQAH